MASNQKPIRVLFRVLLIGFALLAGLAHAQPAAGTKIENQANIHFQDEPSGALSLLDSNTVRVIVGKAHKVDVTDGQTAQYPPGTTVAIPHQITNTGNAADAYTISAINQTSDDFNLVNLHVRHDLDKNGTVDPGEPVLLSIALSPGETVHVVIVGELPAVGSGATAQLALSVQGTGSTAQTFSTIVSSNGATLLLSQQASNLSPAQGEVISLQLLLTNIGSQPAQGVPFLLDDVPTTQVLIMHPVPANTTFTKATGSSTAKLMYHYVGAPAMQFKSIPPADPAMVDVVAYALPSLAVGTSVSFSMQIQINANATGTLSNVAQSQLVDGSSGAIAVQSNTVSLQVAPSPPVLRYYTDASFSTEQKIALVGSSLFLQVDTAGCNSNASVVETLTLTLHSQLTGDTESFQAVETGPNTGWFRVQSAIPSANADQVAPVSGNGQMEVKKHDKVHAFTGGCSTAVADLLIDPYGVVFDSVSNAPVAGATVRLIDVAGAGNGGNAGGPAQVFQVDGTTPAPSTVVTDAQGRFVFPRVAPSIYRLAVQPPSGYNFASIVSVGNLPPGRAIDPSGSFGGSFPVNLATGAVMIDLPVDPDVINGGILVEKLSSRRVAEIGDFVNYSVQVRNVSGTSLPGVVLSDQLPPGFAYVPGSARRDGAPLPDPVMQSGRIMPFALGTLATSATTKVTYRVRIGPGTPLGRSVEPRTRRERDAHVAHQQRGLCNCAGGRRRLRHQGLRARQDVRRLQRQRRTR
ncbi:MAG: hypothetical protein QM776_17895 [Rhodocyclaceae bacterium]